MMTESAIEAFLPDAGTGVVDLYVRETAPSTGNTRQRSCFERLSRLEASGQVDSVTVSVWGNSICTSAPEVNGLSDILETITEIYAFSSGRSVTITPFFRVETVNASITNEAFERIRPPRQTMVLSDDDGIVGVFPCRIGGRTHTPFDAIERLEMDAELAQHEGHEVSAMPHK